MAEKTVLIAPDTYKECMSSPEVAQALQTGLRRRLSEDWTIECRPQADGGEGTVEAIVNALDGEVRTAEVTGPRGSRVAAEWGWVPREDKPPLAVVEMAESSGLDLLDPEQRNPLKTTTRGVGDLIRTAAEAGAREILVGIGGSATVDGGMGMAKALGFEFLNAEGEDVGEGGARLEKIRTIRDEKVPDWVRELRVRVASDVTNPLLGESGAAAVFAPQKGADETGVRILERNLEQWADRLEERVGESFRGAPGAGAAGGIGFGLMALLGAELTSGARLIMEVTGLTSRLSDADVVITGEGKIDLQTAYGKTPFEIAKAAREHGVERVVGVAGALGEGYRRLYNEFDLLVGLPRGPLTLEESMERAEQLLEDWGEDLGRVLSWSESFRSNA